MGYFVLFIVAAIATHDFLRNGSAVSSHIFWNTVIRGQISSSTTRDSGSSAEYSAFRNQDDEDDNEQSHLVPGPYHSPAQHEFQHLNFHHAKDMSNDDDIDITLANEKPNGVRASYMHHSHHGQLSTSSTLRDEPLSPDLSLEPPSRRQVQRHSHDRHMANMDACNDDAVADIEDEPKDSSSRIQRASSWLVYLAEWGLVAFAYVELVTGTVVYSGICRATYTPGCLAHLISEFGCALPLHLRRNTSPDIFSRGKHLFPIRRIDVLSLFRCICRVRLGMEPPSHAGTWHEPRIILSDGGNDRMQRHLHLRHHQYLAGTHGCSTWRSLQHPTNTTHKHCSDVLVRWSYWHGTREQTRP